MILSGRYGDPYGGQADWCRIRESWHVCHFEINHIHSMLLTTAVKRLNRYFCFLLLGFHLPVREKWAKMYKSVSQHNYLSIFLKILSFFR